MTIHVVRIIFDHNLISNTGRVHEAQGARSTLHNEKVIERSFCCQTQSSVPFDSENQFSRPRIWNSIYRYIREHARKGVSWRHFDHLDIFTHRVQDRDFIPIEDLAL